MDGREDTRLGVSVTAATATGPDQAAPGGRPARLILLEDDPEMRGMLASALEGDGHTVTQLRDGNEFLELLRTSVLGGSALGWADLMISDIRMPGCSGLDILWAARTFGFGVPIILITAFGSPETHAEARALGAVAVLDKPFDVDDLRALVLQTLRRSAQRAEGNRVQEGRSE